MNILSIQSHVAYGHVGNSAAVFPLQRLGFEVWPVHTVQFSNHAGYDGLAGRVFPAEHLREVVEGLAARGVLGACDGVLSGYLGGAEAGAAVLEAVDRVKAANPQALYACDPVMGTATVPVVAGSTSIPPCPRCSASTPWRAPTSSPRTSSSSRP